jgi:hypothetical protein
MVTLSGSVGGSSGAKALTLGGSVLVRRGCINDVDVVRPGPLPELFSGCAPGRRQPARRPSPDTRRDTAGLCAALIYGGGRTRDPAWEQGNV